VKLTDKQRTDLREILEEEFIERLATDASMPTDIARKGFKGFRAYSDDELLQEYQVIFGQDYEST